MTIGLCGSLSVTTSREEAGTYQSSNWAWGFGAMMGVYIAGGISGAHLNPVVSLMLCIYRGFPLKYVVKYSIAQLLAAVTAGGTGKYILCGMTEGRRQSEHALSQGVPQPPRYELCSNLWRRQLQRC